MANENLLTLTADIVAAHVGNNAVSITDLSSTISNVYGALAALYEPALPITEVQSPSVSIRASVKPDAIICLECGARQKALKRHIGSAHGLTPAAYREKWNLPASYPMVSANYAAVRSELAKQIGLGRKPGEQVVKKAARKKLGMVTGEA